MGRAVTVATCALNQWALDFEGNLERIFRSECRDGWLPPAVRKPLPLPPSFPPTGAAAQPVPVSRTALPTLLQVSTSPRAKEPGTGLVQSSKSGKGALLALDLVRFHLSVEEQSGRASAPLCCSAQSRTYSMRLSVQRKAL